MKKYISRLVLATLLLVAPLAPVGWTGMTCSSSQQRITYNTLATVGSAVNTAYAAYLDQVVAGKATYSVALANDYNKFQALFNTAVQAASMNLAAPASADLQSLAASIVSTIGTLKHA